MGKRRGVRLYRIYRAGKKYCRKEPVPVSFLYLRWGPGVVLSNTFAPKFINFLKIPVNNSKDFQYAWEDSRKSEIVVIETHERPSSLSTISGTTLYRTNHLPGNKFNLYARVVLLLGCNAGHYDHRYNNVAHAIAQKVPYGIVVASDGSGTNEKNELCVRCRKTMNTGRKQENQPIFSMKEYTTMA